VSLACLGSHFLARYDDGKVVHNLEVTQVDRGGVASDTDDEYIQRGEVSLQAIRCGSDLRAVTPREMLGLFVGLRGRHFENTRQFVPAEPDFLLARYLFPNHRHLHTVQWQNTFWYAERLFEPGEKGSTGFLMQWVDEVARPFLDSLPQEPPSKEEFDGNSLSEFYQRYQIGWQV
jgi:hypothetical protein